MSTAAAAALLTEGGPAVSTNPTPEGGKKMNMARSIRCGWCISGDHDHCVGVIPMTKSGGVWRCPCDCERKHTRCTMCNRRDVEVTTDTSICVDRDDCNGYRAQRRAADPAFRVLDEIQGRKVQAPSARPAPRKVSPAAEARCQCCGEPTKGGKFLPGHDARYVKEQAAAYVNYTAEVSDSVDEQGPRDAIYEAMEALGPALHAKWIKRVESLRAEQRKVKV